ncbi:MAG: SpoIIE family protein phosphatase [Bacteroidia bacterium]|nr:SpoIIE family protein phosphatase [Bacteroidia bacterium]
MGFAIDGFTQPFCKPIKNFSRKQYNANSQNWCAIQDHRGVMYFGNGQVILEYDGVTWNPITVKLGVWIKSMDIDPTGKIYVGAQGDFGYLEPDHTGSLKYHSLIDSLNTEDKLFGNVWTTHAVGQNVYFNTFTKLFQWNGKKVKVITSSSKFHKSFCVYGELYINQEQLGLVKIKNGEILEISGGDQIKEDYVWAMFPYNDQILMATGKQGLYICNKASSGDEQVIERIESPTNEFIMSNFRIYGGNRLLDGRYFLNSFTNGLAILDRDLTVMKVYNKSNGLQDDIVTYAYLDKQGNLWLCHDNGIGRVHENSPFSLYDEDAGINGSISSIKRHKGDLYLGTSKGVYFYNAQEKAQPIFQPIANFSHYTFDLLDLGSSLLMATSDGVFEYKNNSVKKIYGVYSYQFHRSKIFKDLIFVGGNQGLVVFKKAGDEWKITKLPDITDDIIDIKEAPQNKEGAQDNLELWASTRRGGLIKLKMDKDLKQKSLIRYTSENGLPNSVVRTLIYDDNIVFSGHQGLFKFLGDDVKDPTNIFVKDTTSIINYPVESYNDTIGIFRFRQTNNGSILVYYVNNIIGIYEKNKNGYTWYDDPFHAIEIGQINEIYCEDNGISWLGGSDGILVRYDHSIKNDYETQFSCLVRRVSVGNDSMIYGGTNFTNAKVGGFNKLAPAFEQPEELKLMLPFIFNSLTFHFAAPYFDQEEKNVYKYKLEGFDREWSDWSKETKKQYTNLPHRLYKFHVKAKNIYGKESTSSFYEFSILPPWYLTIWAHLGYVLILIGTILGLTKLGLRRVVAEKIKLETLIHERTEEISDQKKRLEEINKELTNLSLVASETDNGVAIASNDGTLEWINEGYTRMMGYNLEELIAEKGKNIREISSYPEIDKLINDCIQQKSSVIYESTLKKQDGEVIYLSTMLTPIYDEKGNLDKLVIVDTDISKLKQIEKQVGDLAKFPEENKNPVMRVDREGTILYNNNASKVLLDHWESGSANKLPKELSAEVSTIFSNAKSKHIEVQVNGQVFSLLVAPIENADYLNIYGQDITEKKKAEEAIQDKNVQLELINKHITDSIQYAKNIQIAILPKMEDFQAAFPDSFILYKPKAVVSGDFYWFTTITKNDKEYHIVAAIDCTGHGVPGAFMSMIGNELLNQIVGEKEIISPATILKNLHDGIMFSLKQSQLDAQAKDGMDLSICVIDPLKMEMIFAGALRPLYMIGSKPGSKLKQIKPDRLGIGGEFFIERNFTNHKVKLEKGQKIYMFTDGIVDQFGGPRNKKFLPKRFRRLLRKIHQLPMPEQQSAMENSLKEWQGWVEQTDDIMVIGIQI